MKFTVELRKTDRDRIEELATAWQTSLPETIVRAVNQALRVERGAVTLQEAEGQDEDPIPPDVELPWTFTVTRGGVTQ